MDKKKLTEILEKHSKWLRDEEDGERADLIGADLSNVDLSNADLRYAILRHADLNCANLSNADLSNANLIYANLTCTSLSNAALTGSDLMGANLTESDLREADLRGANLSGANLSGAGLSDIMYDVNTAFFAMSCPEEGAFVGYKKAHGYIVKLLIPEDAKRSSATTRKCRCSKAKVLSITNIDGSDSGRTTISSNYDTAFVYAVGATAEIADFDEDRWHECAPGIHFFITRDEAVRY